MTLNVVVCIALKITKTCRFKFFNFSGVGPDGTRYKTAYKCESERLELTCPEDHKIKIIRANFGRFSIAICNRHGEMDMSVNCMAPSSTRVMKKRWANSFLLKTDWKQYFQSLLFFLFSLIFIFISWMQLEFHC